MMTTTPSLGSNWAGWLRQHRSILTGLALILAAWVIYLPSVKYGFVNYDDVRILLDHPELYGQKTFSADLDAIFKTCFPREEPLLLRDVTWALDSLIFGFGNPIGYHLGNVLLNGIVVAMMFAFMLGTTRRYNFALAVSIAYLILGIHTEPVAWIMGRKDILSTLFMLGALCAQTRRLTTPSPRACYGWYLVTLASFVCGLLSKINALVFPLVLFLHAILLPYLNGERPPNAPFLWGRRLLTEALLCLPGLTVSVLIYNWYRQTLMQMGIFNRGYTAHGLAHLWNLIIVDPLAFWVYVQQVFLPWHLKVFYTWPELQTAYPLWQITISLSTIAMAGAIGIWLFRRHKDLFFYYSAFFILMVPYANLLYIGIWVAERYLYFPSFCFLAIAASPGFAALRRQRPVLRIVVLAIGMTFMLVNVFQKLSYQPAWRNGETLWQYHLTLPHPSPMAYANLAAYYYADATSKQATPQASAPLQKMAVVVNAGLAEFWPDHAQPPPPATYLLFFLQSIVLELNGNPEAALANLLISDRIYPRFDDTNLYLARLYRKLAGTTSDSRQREDYARAARDRFVAHIAIAYPNRAVPLEAQKELADFEAACSTNNLPAGRADIKSEPVK